MNDPYFSGHQLQSIGHRQSGITTGMVTMLVTWNCYGCGLDLPICRVWYGDSFKIIGTAEHQRGLLDLHLILLFVERDIYCKHHFSQTVGYDCGWQWWALNLRTTSSAWKLVWFSIRFQRVTTSGATWLKPEAAWPGLRAQHSNVLQSDSSDPYRIEK